MERRRGEEMGRKRRTERWVKEKEKGGEMGRRRRR